MTARYTITITHDDLADLRATLARLDAAEAPPPPPLRVVVPPPPDNPADAPPITAPIERVGWLSREGAVLTPPVVPPPPAPVRAPSSIPLDHHADAPPPPPPPSADESEVDAAGERWDAARHASTRAKTADGRWRARRGASAGRVPPPPPPPASREPGDDGDDVATWPMVVEALQRRAHVPSDQVRAALIRAGIDTAELPAHPELYAAAIAALDVEYPT